MRKIIIFDFDGVLADSVQVVFKMNQEAVASINKTLTMEEYVSCFEEHVNKRLAELFHLTEEEKEMLVGVKENLFPQYYNMHTIKLFNFAKELVLEAGTLGELWIISSSPSDLIKQVLEPYGLVGSFTKIIGQNSKAKNIILENEIKGMKEGEVFFITDTTGDIKETRKIPTKILTLAVTWGFHSATLLESEKPDLLVYQPEEILDFIKSH